MFSIASATWEAMISRYASCHSSNAAGLRLSTARTPTRRSAGDERQRELALRVDETGKRDLRRERSSSPGAMHARADGAAVAELRADARHAEDAALARHRPDEPFADADLGADPALAVTTARHRVEPRRRSRQAGAPSSARTRTPARAPRARVESKLSRSVAFDARCATSWRPVISLRRAGGSSSTASGGQRLEEALHALDLEHLVDVGGEELEDRRSSRCATRSRRSVADMTSKSAPSVSARS